MKVRITQANSLANRAYDVLVVDADPSTGNAIREGLGTLKSVVRISTDIEQALLEARRQQPDVVFVNVQTGDNAGAALVSRLRKDFPLTDVVTLSRSQRSELCLAAWRAGATDMLFQPLSANDVKSCVAKLLDKKEEVGKLLKRNVRLRQACKKLNKARHEIGQQVDLLCQDLVKAYQDLAQQLNQTQMSGEFADFLGSELDIESLLRKTLQWVLKRVGPTNAAIFLPDQERNFTLGAFLDLDTNANSILTETMADTIVKQTAAARTMMSWTDDAAVGAAFGQQLLLGRTWVACPAIDDEECIAVVVAFRKNDEPFEEGTQTVIESVTPILGQKIARLIRVHNRSADVEEDGVNNDGQTDDE